MVTKMVCDMRASEIRAKRANHFSYQTGVLPGFLYGSAVSGMMMKDSDINVRQSPTISPAPETIKRRFNF